jgi:ABC-type phosphate transport system auxiliary subunit
VEIKAIATTVGGLCVIIMQIVNLITTDQVESRVDTTHRELAADTKELAEILDAVHDIQKNQMSTTTEAFERLKRIETKLEQK